MSANDILGHAIYIWQVKKVSQFPCNQMYCPAETAPVTRVRRSIIAGVISFK